MSIDKKNLYKKTIKVMKMKFIIFLWFFSSGIIFGQNAETDKLNEGFSADQVFDKIKEYILNDNSDALWKLYEGPDTLSKDTFEGLFLKTTNNNKKMTFEEFSKLIDEIYSFIQENKIENFNFGSELEQGILVSKNINISSGTSSVSKKIRKCAALTPQYFNLYFDESFPLSSAISETKYNICVEIEKKDTLGFRIISFNTETNYLAKIFDLFEYIKNNFLNAEDCYIRVNVLKPKQRISYSFFGQASKEDIEIINKLKILNHEENPIALNVDELYLFSISKLNHPQYIGLIFSENNNKLLVVADGKYGLFEIENIELLRTYIENSRKR